MSLRALPGIALALACAAGQRTKDGPLEAYGPAGITSEAARPQRHALLVGIDAFEDARFTPLRHATADARDLAAALGEFDDVRVLSDGAGTTRTAILSELAALETRIRTPRDTVVLYFSTHGSLGREPGRDLRRYLVASDTRMDVLADTGLSVDALVRKAEALRSRRVLLVLATCHSGRGKSHVPDELAEALAGRKAPLPPLEEVSEAVVVLTAAAFGESAREDDGLGHDVYTYFLLRGLEEGDRDGDGAVTASEAHDYAREHTYEFSGGAQRPTSESSLLGKDPIILKGHPARIGRPVIYSYARSAEGISVLVNGVEKGTLPGGIALQPGSYRMRLADGRNGRTLFEGKVDVRAGEYIDLSHLVPRSAELTGQVAIGALVPLTSAARDALPTMPMGVLRIGLRHFPRDWITPELQVALLTGTGTDPTFAASPLTFHTSGLHLAGLVRREVPFSRAFSIAPGGGLGVLWLSRDFQGTFTAHESVRAMTASALVEASWTPGDRLRLGGRMGLLGIVGRLSSSLGPHLALDATAYAGFSF